MGKKITLRLDETIAKAPDIGRTEFDRQA